MRQTDNIIFCFDGDKAGRKAAWRALENSLALLSDGKYLSFLFLPEGEDPDSYVSQYGKEYFEQQLRKAIPLSEFLFKELCSEVNLQTSEGCAKLVSDATPLLKQIVEEKAPALSLLLLKRLVELSGISQSELEENGLLKVKHKSSTRRIENIPRRQLTTPYHWVILMLLCSPGHIAKLDRSLLVSSHENNEEIAALKTLVDFLDEHPHLVEGESGPSILTYLQDSPYRGLLESIESEMLEWSDSLDLEAEFLGALEKLQQVQRKKRMTELHSKSLDQLTDEEKRELQRLAML